MSGSPLDPLVDLLASLARPRASVVGSHGRRSPVNRCESFEMPEWTKTNFDDLRDLSPRDAPIQWRFARDALRSPELGVSRFTYDPGARMPWGHRHRLQEEVYVVVAGSGRAKLDDEVVELSVWDVLRVAPSVARSFEAGPHGLGCHLHRRPQARGRRQRARRRLLGLEIRPTARAADLMTATRSTAGAGGPYHRAGFERGEVGILALDVGDPVLRVAPGHLALEGGVARRLIRMLAEEVADGEVAELVLAPGLTHVQVMRPRALRRPREEVVVGRLRRRGEQVSQPLQRLDVPVTWLDGV